MWAMQDVVMEGGNASIVARTLRALNRLTRSDCHFKSRIVIINTHTEDSSLGVRALFMHVARHHEVGCHAALHRIPRQSKANLALAALYFWEIISSPCWRATVTASSSLPRCIFLAFFASAGIRPSAGRFLTLRVRFTLSSRWRAFVVGLPASSGYVLSLILFSSCV